MNDNLLLQVTDAWLYSEFGGFFVDPWRLVDRAVVTHAHVDLLSRGCGEYLMAQDGLTVVRSRLDEAAPIHPISTLAA